MCVLICVTIKCIHPVLCITVMYLYTQMRMISKHAYRKNISENEDRVVCHLSSSIPVAYRSKMCTDVPDCDPSLFDQHQVNKGMMEGCCKIVPHLMVPSGNNYSHFP